MGEEERKEDFRKILNHLDEGDGQEVSLVLKEEGPEIGLSTNEMGFRLDRMRRYEAYPWEIQKEGQGVWKAQKNLDWEEEKEKVLDLLLQLEEEIDLQELADEELIGEDSRGGELGMSKADFGSVLAYLRDTENLVNREEEDHWKKLKQMVSEEEKLESIKEAVEEINYEASVEEDHVLVKVITNKYKVSPSGEVEILDDSNENYAREIRKAIRDLNL